MADISEYPARLEIDYPERLDRLTTFSRLLWTLPAYALLLATEEDAPG